MTLTQANKSILIWGSYALLPIAGIVITFSMWFVCGALTGAGHGLYDPVRITYGPFSIYIFLWPFLVTLANAPWPSIRLAAKLVTCSYYVWLLLRFTMVLNVISYFNDLNQSDPIIRQFIIIWIFLFLLTHCLIWLPSLVFRRQPSQRKQLL